MDHNVIIWSVAAAATLGVVIRPFQIPEYVWATLAAAALVLFGLLPWRDALSAAAKGTDVYLFLIGMMLLAEVARHEGLFDWLAAHAVRSAGGSAKRLFFVVYLVGTVVTVFMSNDATAIVLTPAVYAAAKAARATALPYLLICAFIANAASFVLPISNPANFVIFGAHMPPLSKWLALFVLPSIASIVTTYVALRLSQRRELNQTLSEDFPSPPLSHGGACVAVGIGLTAITLLAASAVDQPLGLPTFIAGAAVTAVVLVVGRESPMPILRDITWGVIPLVAGLFILVEGVAATGVLTRLVHLLHDSAAVSPGATAAVAGAVVAVASNIINNLPAGLVATTVGQSADVPVHVTAGLLIGVDLGPNLSVTGSLATILWLTALRREGEAITARQFLKLGLVVMPPALAAALAVLVWMSR